MIVTETQDIYSEVIERIRRLPNRLEKIKAHTFYEGESFSDAVKLLAQDFDSYFLEGNDVLLLKKEVSINIRNINRNINRDGTEFTYIKELDNLFLEIDSINDAVKQKSWVDYFDEEYGDSDCEGVSLGTINKLLDSVTGCCKMLALSRINATEVLSTSLLIQKHPEQFPATTSLVNVQPTNIKVPVSLLTDRELGPKQPNLNRLTENYTVQVNDNRPLFNKPDDDHAYYLNKLLELVFRVDNNLPFAWYENEDYVIPKTANYGQSIRLTVPEFLNLDYCEGLTQGLISEVRNNLLRFTDIKAQDRYVTMLRNTLHSRIAPVINRLESTYSAITLAEVRLQAKYGLNEYTPDSYRGNEELTCVHSELIDLGGILSNVEFWQSVIEEELMPFIALTTSTNKEPQPTEPGAKLQWKGDKTDLAEVVYALYKSERITDTSTGKGVTKKLLAKQLGDLFCIDITDMETPMKGRKSSNKAHYDGKTFTRYLAQIVDNFIKII